MMKLERYETCVYSYCLDEGRCVKAKNVLEKGTLNDGAKIKMFV